MISKLSFKILLFCGQYTQKQWLQKSLYCLETSLFFDNALCDNTLTEIIKH